MILKDRRLELHNILLGIMDNGNVYHQPPESFKLKYPCIVYERTRDFTLKADDISYNKRLKYTLTLIDKDSLSNYLEPLMDLPMCTFDRHFASDGLNHDVFTLYF